MYGASVVLKFFPTTYNTSHCPPPQKLARYPKHTTKNSQTDPMQQTRSADSNSDMGFLTFYIYIYIILFGLKVEVLIFVLGKIGEGEKSE